MYPTIAGRIVDYVRRSGPIRSFDDLLKVEAGVQDNDRIVAPPKRFDDIDVPTFQNDKFRQAEEEASQEDIGMLIIFQTCPHGLSLHLSLFLQGSTL